MKKNLFYVMLAGTVLLSACKTMPQVGSQIGTKVGTQMGAQVGAQIGIGSQIGTQVGAQVGAQIGTQIGSIALPAGASNTGTINGRYVVEIVECTGNANDQIVTVVAMVTNVELNVRCCIGGWSGSLIIDETGTTHKPISDDSYNTYDLPTNVPVRVSLRFRMLPNVATLSAVRIGVNNGPGVIDRTMKSGTVDLHLIPITWVN